jgi:hypothetical protein
MPPINRNTTQPSAAVVGVNRPHQKADDFAIEQDGERIPQWRIVSTHGQIEVQIGYEFTLYWINLEI